MTEELSSFKLDEDDVEDIPEEDEQGNGDIGIIFASSSLMSMSSGSCPEVDADDMWLEECLALSYFEYLRVDFKDRVSPSGKIF